MKIFPPLTEMIWPPGHSTAQVVWGHRYVLLAILGCVATVIVWPALNAPTASGPQPGDIARAPPLKADAAGLTGPAKRTSPPAIHGTLTAADRAIVAPSAMRSGEPVRVPLLTPTSK